VANVKLQTDHKILVDPKIPVAWKDASTPPTSELDSLFGGSIVRK
jgi:hypothetical protein